MRVEEVYLHDVIWVKFPSNEDLTSCRVISINTDNVITAAFYEENIYKETRIDDEWIKGIEPYEYRDPNGRRVIIYCRD